MSGPRLAEIMASRWPQVKMLFVSGHGESVVLQKGLLDLNEHFLQKPFPMPLWLRRYGRSLESRWPFAPLPPPQLDDSGTPV